MNRVLDPTTPAASERDVASCSGRAARWREDAAGPQATVVDALLEGLDDLRGRSVQLLEALIAALEPCHRAPSDGASWLAIDSALSHLHGAVISLRECADSPEGVDLDELRAALRAAQNHLLAWIEAHDHTLRDPTAATTQHCRTRDSAVLH